eukprot:248358_1
MGNTYCPQGEVYELKENDKILIKNACLENKSLKWISMISSMCNESKLTYNIVNNNIHWHITGEPTEGALKVLSEKLHPPDNNNNDNITNIYDLADKYWHNEYRKEMTLEFDRKRKSMSVEVVCNNTNKRYLLVKGAPESLLERSNKIYINNTEYELQVEYKSEIEKIQHKYASNGLRCLGIAYKELDSAIDLSNEKELEYSSIENNLIFVGIIAMQDPPREEVHDAIITCNKAGIRVIVITGDNIRTAEAVCREIGLFEQNEDLSGKSYLGSEFMSLSDTQQNRAIKRCSLFSRVMPWHKQHLVALLQKQQHVVAMTGDGVNDAPALKKADIGVAMGITGTEVAKEAADMILLDDNFASIVNGVEEGRIIFDNLKKSIAYTLSSNIPEIAPFLLFQVAAIPLPLSTVMILLVDLGTDLAPAISMAYEGRESDIMERKPRDPAIHKLVTWRLVSFAYLQIGMLQAIAGFYAYFTVLHGFGFQPGHLLDLDRHRVFNEYLKADKLRDAYYLWCFKPEIIEKCYYYPNFVNLTLAIVDTRKNEFGYYYDQNQWYGYQMNSNNYAIESKKYLTRLNKNLTLNQLNGRDRNGNKCCNIGISECRQQPTDTNCSIDYLAWNGMNGFYNQYWILDNGLNDIFSQNVFTNDKIFKNRRCEPYDYFSLYSKYKNQPVYTCNFFNHNSKPRTYENTKYSLFPMHTRTRTELLATSQTALVMGIFIMQLGHLLTVRTRRSSIFQQGMKNEFMNMGLLFQIFLISVIIYIPFMNIILGSRPLKFIWWTPAFPFFIFIVFLHECRKGLIRKDKQQNGFITRNTYW